MKQHDLIRIRHMLAAATDALNFCKDHSRKDLESDRMLALAITKSIEIIGEAASKFLMNAAVTIQIFHGWISSTCGTG